MAVLPVVAVALMALSGPVLPEWTFDHDAGGWAANGDLGNVAVRGGLLCADGVDSDPFFTCSGLAVEATPWQYVVLTLRATRPGMGELFWTGETAGPYGGFTPEKKTPFTVTGDNALETVVLFPFWHTEGTIRQLRLDLYNGAHFEIDAIRIGTWGADAAPVTGAYSWDLTGNVSAWRVQPGIKELFAPPLRLSTEGKGWAAVRLRSPQNCRGAVLWASSAMPGMQAADFEVLAGPSSRLYNVELQGLPGWQGDIVALGLRFDGGPVSLESLALAAKPSGPPSIRVTYFGFGDALNRVGNPVPVLANLINEGGRDAPATAVRLVLPPGLRVHEAPQEQKAPPLSHGSAASLEWIVSADAPGDYNLTLGVDGTVAATAAVTFTPSLKIPRSPRMPAPTPIRSQTEVCAYYFPGWDSAAKWECIRSLAPNRKPVLGYYDEANPDCVDWQIKWAAENAITCFLVDWYWNTGQQQLTHWFEAYRRCRFRNMLKVAIMWANHNPPGTHSLEDMQAVTRHWIDHYFKPLSYLRINGRPAVFIWSPSNIRRDLGGSEAVKRAYDECQALAVKAGLPGITFVAMEYDFSPSSMAALAAEGYYGVTSYHEWGIDNAEALGSLSYRSVVAKSPEAWVRKKAAAGTLEYYPVVDTGWDSRPWTGDSAFMVHGRTPERFKELLRSARDFVRDRKSKLVILGPVNEWGEGSYIEPNLEFGFSMYEAVRQVFGRGSSKSWGVNFGPADIGLGPYDYPPSPPVAHWTFNEASSGWRPVMGLAEIGHDQGGWRLRTVSDDPALIADANGLDAGAFSKLRIAMQVEGQLPETAHGQVFWSMPGRPISAASSVTFPLERDGAVHTYTLDLGGHPRWRDKVYALRFDPVNVKDVQVVLVDISLER